MTVTIELPPDIEAGLLAQAEGVDVSDYVQNLVRRQMMAQASSPCCELSPDNLPILSDEAISRDSIYD